ncbi:hypothetical protein F0562_004765 [Nyssa sinensis]|uniref:DUF3444 domain-containing protein n=1 Tax=Nyssa sinensis TaxID=561372 RepID=A0A5J5AK81_9ASTE|nr:hypothetical protein F0562_004765 [Nyssa sinensis]
MCCISKKRLNTSTESLNVQESCDVLGHNCCIIQTLVQREDTLPSSASCERAVCETSDVADAQMRDTCSKERNFISDQMNMDIDIGKERPVNDVASPVGSDCSSEKLVASKSCDQEFYYFDNIRKGEVFAVSQVWAAYDEENMPRKYAQICNIDELPFRFIQISWWRNGYNLVTQCLSWTRLAVPNILDYDMVKSSEEGSSSEYYSFTHCQPVPQDIESIKLRWPAEDFASEQIWAVYNGPDSMPRQYVIVNIVVSENEVCVTLQDDEIYWVEENLPFVCGSFRAVRTILNLGISRFSHLG